MAGANYIFQYLSSVWDYMPAKDKNRFGELWRGYEQVFADPLQRFFELNQTVSVNNMPVFLTTRWNKYAFGTENQLLLPATFTAFQDVSLGVNLSARYLVRMSVNGGNPIEVDCRGLVPSSTTLNEIKFAINRAFGFDFASGVFENTTLRLTTREKGPSSKIEILRATNAEKDATEIIFGLTAEELPYLTPEYPFVYKLNDKRITKIPSLQDAIRIESLGYYVIEGPDYVIDRQNGWIRMREQPRPLLWAKVTYINEEMPFNNFGWLIDYVDNTVSAEDYLQNLQGLWFAFWQGPRPEFIRRALYLLFSLPVSARNGVVTGTTGTTMQILHDDNVVRTYVLPSQLEWLIQVGDYVERFQPLVTGIDVFDKVNHPGFVRTEIGRDAINIFALPEATKGDDPNTDESKALIALEEHTFLPQINVNAFVRPNINIGTVFSFLRNIKPLSKAFYFQVIVAVFGETLALDERLQLGISLDVTPNLDINQANTSDLSTQEQYETSNIPALDLDSDTLGFFDKISLSIFDKTGPLEELVFD